MLRKDNRSGWTLRVGTILSPLRVIPSRLRAGLPTRPSVAINPWAVNNRLGME